MTMTRPSRNHTKNTHAKGPGKRVDAQPWGGSHPPPWEPPVIRLYRDIMYIYISIQKSSFVPTAGLGGHGCRGACHVAAELEKTRENSIKPCAGVLGSHLGARKHCAGLHGSHLGARKHRTGLLGRHLGARKHCTGLLGNHLGARKHCTGLLRSHLGARKHCTGLLRSHLGARKYCTSLLRSHLGSRKLERTRENSKELEKTREGSGDLK